MDEGGVKQHGIAPAHEYLFYGAARIRHRVNNELIIFKILSFCCFTRVQWRNHVRLFAELYAAFDSNFFVQLLIIWANCNKRTFSMCVRVHREHSGLWCGCEVRLGKCISTTYTQCFCACVVRMCASILVSIPDIETTRIQPLNTRPNGKYSIYVNGIKGTRSHYAICAHTHTQAHTYSHGIRILVTIQIIIPTIN